MHQVKLYVLDYLKQTSIEVISGYNYGSLTFALFAIRGLAKGDQISDQGQMLQQLRKRHWAVRFSIAEESAYMNPGAKK